MAHEHEWEEKAERELEATADGVDPWVLLQTDCAADPVCIAERLAEEPGWPGEVSRRLREADGAEREIWIETMGAMGSATARDLLAESADLETEALLRLRVAELLIACGDLRGLAAAADLLGEATPRLVREEAHALLAREAGEGFGYDASGAEGNLEALARIRAWIGNR